MADYCSASEVCVSGSLTCRASSLCSGYIKNYRKACYGNNVFWYDNYGVRQGLHKSCNDNNSCTLDTCFLTTCENRPICDSKECIKGSDDYCQICNHIGDGDCNCSETFATAPADCQASQTFYCPPGSDSAILILAKKSNTDLWNKNISAAKKETIDFMIILTNKNSQPISNGIVKIILPEEIKQKGSVNVNNVLHLGSIESGIVIDFLEQNQIKIITFQGEILAKEGDLTVETSLIAGNYSAKDYSKIVLERPETQIAETQMAAIGGVFANLFKGPYSIFFLLLLAIAVLYFIIKIAYKSLKQEG